jgi:maltose O-acetyltransferase
MGVMKRRMLRGDPYIPDGAELAADHARANLLLQRFNASRHDEREERDRLRRKLFNGVGDGVIVKPPLLCEYGSYIEIGARTVLTYGCVLQDVASITIGESCRTGPRVQPLTLTHPLDAVERRSGWRSARPIVIGDTFWLCGGAIVNPGVTIGANSIVGAGAVVTADIPDGVMAVGCPARVLREIDEIDRLGLPDVGDFSSLVLAAVGVVAASRPGLRVPPQPATEADVSAKIALWRTWLAWRSSWSQSIRRCCVSRLQARALAEHMRSSLTGTSLSRRRISQQSHVPCRG